MKGFEDAFIIQDRNGLRCFIFLIRKIVYVCNYKTFHSYLDKPKVSLSLGKSIEMNKIKEGEDIYLECSVDSRPTPYKLFFKHKVWSCEARDNILYFIDILWLGTTSGCEQTWQKNCLQRHFSHPKYNKTWCR